MVDSKGRSQSDVVCGADYASFHLDTDHVALLDTNGEIMGKVPLSEIEDVLVCFASGTKIATPKGEVAVETLRAGDKVFTRDNGIQEIAWTGSRTLTTKDLLAAPDLQPVLVRAGSLGSSLPEKDLLLSRNHRLLMSGRRAALHFSDTEVFAAAKYMTATDGIDAVQISGVTYVHLMFAQHEVILSNGTWTESFQPADHVLNGIHATQRAEIFDLFPDLGQMEAADPGFGNARRVLKRHEAAILIKG
ncbi:hypothetical protein FHS72_003692 [Loktanella ponticola]|uniref:Hedgehog/Intein (Hint) domain-containing protein n=1 Tax=Yoonia ponticola TaxID=1524255 RepID=A0A7W9EZQ2_9RHOB|nr:Hint domain-containing protein [Yoonia ponticola]MBB5724042.1 hypothetical protein [Yoonia ponticola]